MKYLVTLLVFVVCFANAQTAFTATYSLAGGGNDVTSFAYNGTTYAGISVGALTKNGFTSSSSTGNYRGSNWPTGATTGSDVFSGSVDLAKYIAFTISAQSGYRFTISSITFGVGRSSTGPRQSEWRGSSDSYASVLTNYTALNASVTNSSGILQTPDANSGYTGNTLTISSGYTDVTTSAEFRYYMLNSEAVAGTGGLQGNITITGTFDVSLPVELVSFTAVAKGKNVELLWNTATEKNNRGFDVEKNVNGAWTKIGFVAGAGNSNAPKSYAYTDASAKGASEYRLKQIDNDGAFTYSAVVNASAPLTAADYQLGQNYPNPFNPTTMIRFAMAAQEHVSLTVYNALGQEVASLFNGVAQPNQMYELPFNGSNLASGTYFYALRSASRNEVRKMLLSK